jgi:hypothetical protein
MLRKDLQSRLNRLTRAMRTVLIVLTAGGLFVSSALAVSPALHKRIHHDADSPDHVCFVTLLAHGQVLPAEPVTALAAVVLFVVFLKFLTPRSPDGQRDLLLPAGRGPPLVLPA